MMTARSRVLLDDRIKAYVIEQLKTEFQDDYRLIADKVESLIQAHTFKDLRYLLRKELLNVRSLDFDRTHRAD
ncbi:hypothetical protein WBG78_07430 [Chryseolinea sp. T2]|uniref:hypothetical protein n=1 Tax=Chryseolinea sp. T2 TaxID=3129255 RepID=UPI0030775F15